MDVRPLHDEDDYNWAVGEVSRYFEAQPAIGTPASDRFEVLATLIRAYEDTHFQIPNADPVQVLEFAIQSMGKTHAGLSELIGRNRTSEILNRVRPLTLDMIRTISAQWHIPIALLTSPYQLAKAQA
ncbi:XRE family transcriptional regulator [Bradyrhizobium sp. INPA01-394B]|uniref:XRE family transcriptional regulator n=1 Tax=Bradyrhizobium campsiandrae TaxID=1729892 RepID=A0ABR7TZC4_9BRAD|nr:XRE family transcriptional regulator [Bradyrhizobium campsiandrae]MBC9883444.1 XRE family transcriptional regulator [Bradyrhizobium campsiandrae]MBC9976680.1 XRE family transcriptional regulator [Bradyrhizobium campsiandrae]